MNHGGREVDATRFGCLRKLGMRSGTRSTFKVGWIVVELPIVGFTLLSTITMRSTNGSNTPKYHVQLPR